MNYIKLKFESQMNLEFTLKGGENPDSGKRTKEQVFVLLHLVTNQANRG